MLCPGQSTTACVAIVPTPYRSLQKTTETTARALARLISRDSGSRSIRAFYVVYVHETRRFGCGFGIRGCFWLGRRRALAVVYFIFSGF